MEAILESETRKWFNLLDDLRHLGIGDNGFQIPQIAVIGDQSSGKSSLLEAMSGIPFPRGLGLVTRCPTCISMLRTTDDCEWHAELTVKQDPNSRLPADIDGLGTVYNVSDLASRISQITEQLVKDSTHGFSFDIIHVRVTGPDVVDLTIIDLPGIIRTTTAGQNQGVISQVDRLLDHFMKQSRTIILAVIPANQDIATVDVLERASVVDPMGSRTIGVLTKVDLVDQGAEHEILSVVQNYRKPLSLGYVMVKCRNQAQLSAGLSLDEAQRLEEEYFDTHPVWSSKVAKTLKGVKSLSKKLSKVLLFHAQESLPVIKGELLQKLHTVEQDIATLKESNSFFEEELEGTESTNSVLKLSTLHKNCFKILAQFGQCLRHISEGIYVDSITQSDPKLRIKFHLDNIFAEFRENISKATPNFDSSEFAQLLSVKISELRGRELPGFLCARLLLSTISENIDSWRDDLEVAFTKATDVFNAAAAALINSIAPQYPLLCKVINGILETISAQMMIVVRKRTEELFQVGGLESLSTDKDLVACIDSIRFQRFETALRDVLQSAGVGGGKMTKADLKTHVIDMMGHHYLHMHSVGYGPSLQLEDAITALKAYWKMAEMRLCSNASAAVDQGLLVKGSVCVERTLLELAQSNWTKSSSEHASSRSELGSIPGPEISDGDSFYPQIEERWGRLTISELMAEDEALQLRKRDLVAKKKMFSKALDKINLIAPNCIAVKE